MNKSKDLLVIKCACIFLIDTINHLIKYYQMTSSPSNELGFNKKSGINSYNKINSFVSKSKP